MGALFFDDLENRRAEIERHRENSARLALSFAKFETTGQGTMQFEDRVDFGLTYIEKPYVTFAGEIDLDELSDQLNVDANKTPPLPSVSGFVVEWDQDDRSFYTGCWIAVSVYYSTLETTVLTTVPVKMNHHFTFTGTAIKDIPIDEVRD